MSGKENPAGATLPVSPGQSDRSLKNPTEHRKVTAQERLKRAPAWLLRYSVFVIFALMVVVAATVSDSFFTQRNIFNLLRQVTPLGVMSMGMLFVILTGGIDLSIGSGTALAGVLLAYLIAMGVDLYAALGLTILAGILCGVLPGYLVAFRSMAPFVATLAMMTILRGATFMLSRGTTILVDDAGLATFGSGAFLGVPYPVYVLVITFAAGYFVLEFTVFGRLVKAVGSNATATRLAGIRIWIYRSLVYCLSGALWAVAGIIGTARTGVGSPVVGVGAELDAIAAVVIGGASLSGGTGSAINTLVGVLTLGMIGNVLNLMNIASYPQQIIKGGIIIFAVLLSGWQRRSSERA
jgi:ribose transport system permease protein